MFLRQRQEIQEVLRRAGMNTWIVLLRAVNVGGTGKLPMAELRDMC